MTYKRILIAVDGSDATEKALDYAIDLAKNEGTTLTVLNVAELPYSRLPTMRSKDVYGPYLNLVKESHSKILDDAIQVIKEKAPNAQVSKLLAIGDPAKKITEVGNTGNFDLIITGCRALTKGSQFFFGSVSKKVTKIASCPVMVVKPTISGN